MPPDRARRLAVIEQNLPQPGAQLVVRGSREPSEIALGLKEGLPHQAGGVPFGPQLRVKLVLANCQQIVPATLEYAAQRSNDSAHHRQERTDVVGALCHSIGENYSGAFASRASSRERVNR